MRNPTLFWGLDGYGQMGERIPATYFTDVTLRDLFAAIMAHGSLVAVATRGDIISEEEIAAAAYRQADKLLAARAALADAEARDGGEEEG